MRNHRSTAQARRAARTAFLLIAVAAPGPVLAQSVGTNSKPSYTMYGQPVSQSISPAEALSRNLRLIESNPRNFTALVDAGRAALELGDHPAAVGFFGRAEEISPTAFAPKVGMGAASVQMGDARAALIFFAQAQQLGATNAVLGAHRGLAQDLLGNQVAAQNDYRAALSGPDRDEARRRLALSLAISRDTKGAIAMLQPLLNQRDPAAQRARAFILALGGDRAGARSAIDSAMPGSSARIDPFFMVLPSLSNEQKASAVHLGIFPTASEMKLAVVSPPPTAAYPVPRAPVTRAPAPRPPVVRAPPPMEEPVERVDIGRPEPSSIFSRMPEPTVREAPTVPSAPTAVAQPPRAAPTEAGQPSFDLAATIQPGVAAGTPSTDVAPSAEVAALDLPATSPVADSPVPSPGFATGLDRLSGIDDLLDAPAQPSPPPAPRPKYELASLEPTAAELVVPRAEDRQKAAEETAAEVRKAAAARKAAEAKKTADARKIADAKKAADAKKLAAAKQAADEKKEREALGVAGTNWIQLAGGSNADRMGAEYKKLAAKSSALKKRSGHVTQGKDYFRLLTGPFDSKNEAQSFVNQLAKDGVDGFSWTRTPATIKIEKLPTK